MSGRTKSKTDMLRAAGQRNEPRAKARRMPSVLNRRTCHVQTLDLGLMETRLVATKRPSTGAAYVVNQIDTETE